MKVEETREKRGNDSSITFFLVTLGLNSYERRTIKFSLQQLRHNLWNRFIIVHIKCDFNQFRCSPLSQELGKNEAVLQHLQFAVLCLAWLGACHRIDDSFDQYLKMWVALASRQCVMMCTADTVVVHVHGFQVEEVTHVHLLRSSCNCWDIFVRN